MPIQPVLLRLASLLGLLLVASTAAHAQAERGPEAPPAASTEAPSAAPAEAPSAAPAEGPSAAPSEAPGAEPAEMPVATPSEAPRAAPTEAPRAAPVEPQRAGPAEAPRAAATASAVETVLQARNKVVLELGRKPVNLTMTIRSYASGRRLQGDVSFQLSSDDSLEPTDSLTCVPSLSLGCGVVARFSSTGKAADAPSVFEAQLEGETFRIRDLARAADDGSEGRGFEDFVESAIESTTVAVKVRVDQQQDFIFDLRRLPWPLADFAPDNPFGRRFGADPVLAGLKRRFPARYLKIVSLARKTVPDTGSLSPEAETAILEAMHSGIGGLRPMVPDDLLEKIVVNADAAARQIGTRDVALCNALAVAARSAVTTPALKDSPVAREEYELWRQVVEQANPRFIRKVPNAELLPSTPRFEENMRQASSGGCGMFAAVTEAILKLPRDERRLWLRATVGTIEDLRPEAAPRRR